MKYLILGAGGTGGCIGGYLGHSGKDVTFIARGAHLQAIRETGLIIHSSFRDAIKLKNVKAYAGEEAFGQFDVIFVCVKGYSLAEAIPIIKKAAHAQTIVIPILNTLSAGERLGAALPGMTVLDGCVYVSAHISAPGEIIQGLKILRVVFGTREKTNADMDLLRSIQADLEEAGIDAVLSSNIKRDIFRKFSFISAFAAAGAYFDVMAGDLQQEGESREMFIALLKELQEVANALGIKLNTDLVEDNLRLVSGMNSDTTASMQKDMKANKNNEKDEIIFDVVRLAEKYDVDVPNYKKIAEHFGYTLPRP